MKIAISTENNTIDSKIDPRFGRCKYFLVADLETKELIKAVENEGALQGHGAGTKAAQQVGELGADAVITGDVGPNASEVLDKLGIKAYHASGSVSDALDKFRSGQLDVITKTAEPHSGLSDVKVETEGERIFFPLLDNSGMESRISPHFGHAPFFGLYEPSTKKLTITGNDLNHTDPTKSPVDQIVEAVNPTMVFCQGIGARAIGLFSERGISLKTGPYGTVREAIANLDSLEDQSADCGHGHH